MQDVSRRRCLALLGASLAAAGTPRIALAETMKDAQLRTYVRYANANIRIDKIERVLHADGRPIIKDSAVQPENGYLIYSISVQNPGKDEIGMPSFGFVEFLDDESKIDVDTLGPYVGAAKSSAPDRLAPKESVRVHVVHAGIPPERSVTKIVLDPNQASSPKLRFQIRPGDIVQLDEVPKPAE